MPTSGSSIFTDPEDYQASLHQTLDLLAVPPGGFNARLTQVELPNLRLFRARESVPRVACVSLPPEFIFVTFLTQRDPPVICDGADLEFGDILFHSSGERFYQRTTAPSHWGAISLTPASLMTFGRTLAGRDLTPPPVGRILRPHPADRTRLLRLHAEAARIAETKLVHIAHPEVAHALDQDLMWALVICVTGSEERADPTARRNRARILQRIEELVAANPAGLPPLREVCGTIDVSEQIVRACCLKGVGMPPGRYLRLRRLKLARAALRSADPATASVAEVARRHGFPNPHRFAKEYFDTYGEVPALAE